MTVESLNSLSNTLTAFKLFTVQDPHLYSSHQVSVVFKIVHLSDRNKADSILTALNDNRRRRNDKFIRILVGGCSKTNLNRSDLCSSSKLYIERMLMIVGWFSHREENYFIFVAFFIDGPVWISCI